MNLSDFLLQLSGLGVKMWTEQGQLKLRAPKGVLTPALQETLAARKPEILAYLARGTEAIAIQPVDRERPLAVSFMQERLWFLAQMYPKGVAYNLPNGYHLVGELNVPALQAALQTIVNRHESLRTTFAGSEGGAVQCVHPALPLDLQWHDFSGEDAPRKMADKLASRDANHSFDLEQGPLFLCRLVRLASDEHLLLWTVHHIVADGWSSLVFLRELKALYEANCAGHTANLPALPLAYADFAAWERVALAKGQCDDQLDYWRAKLRSPLPVLELPIDFPRPAVLAYRGDFHSFTIPSPIRDRLKALAVNNRSTLFMVLLAAYKLLLKRYSQAEQICIGSPIARRTRPEIENVFGCFINALPLVTDLTGNPAFADLLARVRETCTGAFGHPDVPFEKMLELSEAPRDTSHTPLFQSMFILHVQDTRKVSTIGDVALSPVEYHTSGSKFDLTLELKETTDSLEGFLEYNTDLFEAASVGRMANHFQRLLESIAASPHSRLSDLSMLDPVERDTLLHARNATQLEYPPSDGVHMMFARQALSHPASEAVRIGGQCLSYRELDERSNQLARHLRGQGARPGMLVGICLERSLDMVVALFGVLKSGAAYVPLDPAFPSERLGFMVNDAAVGLLLTHTSLRAAVPSYTGPLLFLDSQWSQVASEASTALVSEQRPEDLAYVIYTSGSTGKPKGVQIPHRALTNFLYAMTEQPGITAGDCLLAVTTLSFDIAALELYLPLVNGARVVLASQEEAADGVRLGKLVASSGATVMQATPATWRLLLESGWRGISRLKVLCGGEGLPRHLAEQLLALKMDLWNLYGPTETTIWSAVEHVASGEGPVAIGRPVGNTQLYVLDGEQALLPDGVVGELYIGGEGLARGYLNRPELTAERFVKSPFQAGKRLYRTGDLARYHPDGRLEVLGRTDHQVKVRGYRIELGEIEAGLLSHPAVSAAVVVVREDVAGDKRIVAYVVGSEVGHVGSAELRAHLQRELPDYMVPTAFVALECLPLTPNNKVDRKALPPPEGALVSGARYVAPNGDLELGLAQIWAQTLRVERVGVTDDFFELGGHSLLAVRLVADIQRQLGLRIPLAAVFQGRNIRGILHVVHGAHTGGGLRALVPLRSGGRRPPFFCGGSHPRYQNVVSYMDPDQPCYRMDVYGLQQDRLGRGLKPLRTIEEIAAVFLAEIRTVQPTGPYYLGGGCEGGLVAFEVAKQLQAMGEQVARLVIWLVAAPQLFSKPSKLRVLRGVAQHFLNWISRQDDKRPRWRDLMLVLRHEYIEFCIFNAIESYRPVTRFQGSAFLARHYLPGYPEYEEESLGWKHLVSSDVTVHALPGKHESWLEVYSEEFGRLLDRILLEPAMPPRSPDLPGRPH